ncbi:MAG: response regulator [Lentisphaeria bacterium]|nr:response regulator [Lentisphaeria bacterium]
MPDTTTSGVDTSGFGELEELVHHLIHESPLGIFLYALNEGGELIFRGTNQTACDLLGVDCHHFIGKTIEQAFPALAATEIPPVYKKLAAEGGSWMREQVDYEDNGVRRAYSVHAFQTSPGRMATMFLDITNQKQLEAQMRNAQKLESLGVLAGGIAHDFNNLLCAILGGADLALDLLPPDHIARDSLEMVHDTAQRATELCRQMLAYSGKGKFQLESVDISDVIRGMERLINVSVSKKTTLHLVTPDHVPRIDADAAQLRQVILNLVVNASEALPDEGGMVTVKTGVTECDEACLLSVYLDNKLAPGRYVFVDVSDTGRGMDKTAASRLFDPFYTTKQTGRGLGLAAVLGIVRGHGGTIKVQSEPGQGTRFTVLFPVSNTKKAPVPAAGGTGHDRREGLSVLLVDDEPSVRQVGKLMLERLGCHVLTAVDGKDGLDVYQRHEKDIQLVILDMTMPRMNGKETFRELRRVNPRVKIILTSGYDAQDATSHFADKGLTGFMQKPFQLKTMRQCVNEALDAPSA